MLVYTGKILPNQPKENPKGNKEYKRKLIYDETDTRGFKVKINKRATQMLYRILEGNGRAIYLLGVEDNGEARGISLKELNRTIDILYKIADIINAKIKIVRVYMGTKGFIGTVRIILNEMN